MWRVRKCGCNRELGSYTVETEFDGAVVRVTMTHLTDTVAIHLHEEFAQKLCDVLNDAVDADYNRQETLETNGVLN